MVRAEQQGLPIHGFRLFVLPVEEIASGQVPGTGGIQRVPLQGQFFEFDGLVQPAECFEQNGSIGQHDGVAGFQ